MLEALYGVAATVRVDLRMTERNNSVSAPDAVKPLAGTARVDEVVNLVTSRMKQWQGNAALAFTNYLDRNADAAALQRDVALSLAVSLEAQLEVNRRINTDIWEIGQKTYKALDGLDAWCPGGNASKSVALLTIGGAIAAVIFAGATAGAGTAAFAAAVGVEGWQSLATIWSNSAPLKTEEAPIGGMTVPPIITGMQNAMQKLTKSADTQQQELVRGISEYTQAVHSNWHSLLIDGPEELGRVRSADRAGLENSNGIFVR